MAKKRTSKKSGGNRLKAITKKASQLYSKVERKGASAWRSALKKAAKLV